MFNCKELPYANRWDGHTSAQAADRLHKLNGYIMRKIGYK